MKLAILHQELHNQLSAHFTLSKGLELLFVDVNLSDFLNHLGYHHPDALVVDLDLLGNYPMRTLQELKRGSSAQLIMVSYLSARWNIIEQLNAEGVHLIKAPLTAHILQTYLERLATRQDKMEQQCAGKANAMHFGQWQPLSQSPFLQNFNMAAASHQLAHFATSSQLNTPQAHCECINHLTDIVMSLAEFEKYTQNCADKTPTDAEIHKMLQEEAHNARAMMEKALKKLCEHEKASFSQPSSVSI